MPVSDTFRDNSPPESRVRRYECKKETFRHDFYLYFNSNLRISLMSVADAAMMPKITNTEESTMNIYLSLFTHEIKFDL